MNTREQKIYAELQLLHRALGGVNARLEALENGANGEWLDEPADRPAARLGEPADRLGEPADGLGEPADQQQPQNVGCTPAASEYVARRLFDLQEEEPKEEPKSNYVGCARYVPSRGFVMRDDLLNCIVRQYRLLQEKSGCSPKLFLWFNPYQPRKGIKLSVSLKDLHGRDHWKRVSVDNYSSKTRDVAGKGRHIVTQFHRASLKKHFETGTEFGFTEISDGVFEGKPLG